MPEKSNAEQGRQILDAENLRHETVGQRHGAKPGNAHRDAEAPQSGRRQWQRNEQRDRDRPRRRLGSVQAGA